MAIGAQLENRRRGFSLALSVAIHAAVLMLAIYVDPPALPPRAPSEYNLVVTGKEEKIVWYKFRKDLPDVTPPRATGERRPLRAVVKSEQSVVSSPKNAPPRPRMVWTPAPVIAVMPPLESPNLIAIKLPDPPVKTFVAPPDVIRPPAQQVDVPAAPDVKAPPLAAALRPVALPPKPFQPPPAAPALAAARPQLAPDAPTVETKPLHADPVLSARLPPKPYIPPPPARRVSPAVVASLEAPPAAAAAAPADSLVPGPTVKLPPRPFIAPARPGPAPAKSVSVDTPPPIDAPANSKDLNVAMVGLNPVDKLLPLPTASSPAAFSAGPKIAPKGAASDAGAKGLSVPDLFVRTPHEGKAAELLAGAYVAPTSSETLRAAMLRGEPVMTVHVGPAPASAPEAHPASGAAKVSSAPDPRMNGRDIYMMAIQMPNLTSYSGSWLLWYADRTAREAGLAPLSPPVAHRKVDPKYTPAAVQDRAEGRVQLACVIDKEGNVSGIELLRGADARLNQSAQEALSKWQFYPATRDGAPVDVDVVVEIPFTLAPPPPRR